MLDVGLFVLSALRLHNVDTEKSEFVLYLTLVLGFGWLLLGDIDHMIAWIDWGTLQNAGSASRGIVTRCMIFAGLLYVNVRGESRHKCQQPKQSIGRTVDKLS